MVDITNYNIRRRVYSPMYVVFLSGSGKVNISGILIIFPDSLPH